MSNGRGSDISDIQGPDSGRTSYAEPSCAEPKEQKDNLDYCKIEAQLIEILLEIEEIKQRKQALKMRTHLHTLQNIMGTFNIYPPADTSRYFRKANIARSPAAALASDWNNVFKDLYVSFLRETSKVKHYLV